ncbi:hypothetical protein HF086_008676 [Spodoptera exigua]|uniref:Uncharacterized protein n=1 Tax=Spodoptera exigua TaxID=7107 RepID=A0A922MWR4_SPOEX|nr:hypothetical protein HF086_008676 [Spodoptera exigua]
MTSSSAKVDDIFREAGTAFNKLSEMTMSLQAAEDSFATDVWSPEDLEALRSSVHRFAVELNKISQHIKIRTMFHLRRFLEMDSGAIQDVQGSPPDANQTTCGITSMYIIQTPSLATWLAYAVPVSTFIPNNNPQPTNRPQPPQATPTNQINQPSASNVMLPDFEIQSLIQQQPVLDLLTQEPSLQLPVVNSESPEDNETSENELDGFNPEVVPPVPPEQILQPEKKRKPKRKEPDHQPGEGEVNNNECGLTVQQIVRYLDFENTLSTKTQMMCQPNEQPAIEVPPSIGLAGPVPSNNAELPLISGQENQVTAGQNYQPSSYVANQLHSETTRLQNDNDFKLKTNTSLAASQQQPVLSPPKEYIGKRESNYITNSKYNRPNKQTSTIKKKKQAQNAVPAQKRTPPTKGRRAQTKQNKSKLRDFIKTTPKINCQDENARDGDAKEDQSTCVYAEHIIDDSSIPIPVSVVDHKTNNKTVEEKPDPFIFCDIVEPAPDPLSTFRARWCFKKYGLSNQSTSHQPPATSDVNAMHSLEMTPKKSPNKDTPKTAEAATPNTTSSEARVLTRSKSRHGGLLEPLLPPKRSRRGTKKISEK